MPVDARRARHLRAGKADRIAASRKAYLVGAVELRCPKCASRRVSYQRTRGMNDQYNCGRCFISFTVDAARLPRKPA